MTEPRHTPDGPSAATRDAIRAMVVADLRPVRARSLASRALIVSGASLGAMALVLLSFGPMAVQGIKTNGAAMVVGAVVTLLGTLATAFAFAPRAGRRSPTWTRVALLLIFLLGWAIYLGSMATGELLESALAPVFSAAACARSWPVSFQPPSRPGPFATRIPGPRA